MRSWILVWLALGAPAFGASEGYTNTNTVEAERALAKIAGRDPSKLKAEADRKEWARARLAWIALARLQGRTELAMRLFTGCEQLCEKFGPEEEWKAAREWACREKPAAKGCEK